MRFGRLLAATALALGLLAVPAAAAERTITMRTRPFALGSFETLRPKLVVPSVPVDGFITRMHARLVDVRGRQVSVQRVMLHHVVFINRGRFAGDRTPKCGTRFGEPFYGTGEEDETLRVPHGYGYRTRRGDIWKLQAMLMSHSLNVHRVYVEYRMRVSTRRLRAVMPYWARVTDCRNDPSWSVPGGGPPGSKSYRSNSWRVPADGLLVSGAAHVHGGNHDIELSEPACGGRQLIHSPPAYGMPDDLMYRLNPILHEPGPMNTGWFESTQGIAVHRGEHLKLTASYDAEHPHMGVMGVYHLYIAEGPVAARAARGTRRCAPLPADTRVISTRMPHRNDPPAVTIPLSQLVNGRPRVLAHPPGEPRTYDAGARPTVDVDYGQLRPVNLSVATGTPITWNFNDSIPHKVQLANGPRATGSPTLFGRRSWTWTFTTPGTYQLFCPLHPMTMHQEVVVRPADGTAATPLPPIGNR